MRAPYRFLQVGLGPLGVRIAGDLIRRRVGAIAGAVDPAHAGRGLAELVAGADPAVRVVASVDELAGAFDAAIVSTVSDLPGCAPVLHALIDRKIHVVSTCEELSYPWNRHPELAGELMQRALGMGVHVVGTGVNPGFVMDALPVALTTVCHAVRRVEIHRIQDASLRRLPFQAKIGATLSVEEFEARAAAGTVRHVGLAESIGMIAGALGLRVDRVDESIAPVVADAELGCGLGVIAAGAVRGVHQEARAYAGDREVIALVFQAAIGEPSPRDHVIVEGEPDLQLVIPGGVHGDVATSAITINTIVGLLDRAGAPGLHTMSTLPLGGCSPPR